MFVLFRIVLHQREYQRISVVKTKKYSKGIQSTIIDVHS